MKPHITFDLLRGILVASIARDAVKLLSFMLPLSYPASAIPPEHRSVWGITIALTFAVYSVVLLASLLRPASTIKAIFGALLAIAVVWSGVVASLLPGPIAGERHNPMIFLVTGFLFGPPLTAFLAFLCVLKLRREQHT